MKKLLSLFILSATLFAACSDEPTNQGPKDPVLTLTSEDLIEVAYNGGQFTIEYTLENKLPDVPITVTCDADWIKDITVALDIDFRVENNPDFFGRETTILVEHATESFTVTVRQDGIELAADVEYKAPKLNGEYYGTSYSPGYNYFIILSNNGATGWNPSSYDTYYRIDLYSDTPAADPSAPVVPVGTYHIDYTNSGLPGTLGAFYTVRLDVTPELGMVENKINDGTLIVTETGLEAIFMFADGEIHHVTYEGSLVLGYDAPEEPDHYSYLTEDYIFENEGATLRAIYYGDYYGLGYGNWEIQLMETTGPINGAYFSIDIVADSMEYAESAFIGEYEGVAKESLAPNTFLAGKDGSLFRMVEDDYIVNESGSYLFEGSVKIEQNGGSILVTIDCLDDLGHKISGTYDCSSIEIYDWNSMQ